MWGRPSLDNGKILAQVLPANTNETLAYTVPSAAAVTSAHASVGSLTAAIAPKSVALQTQAIVTSIHVCNVHSGAVTFKIRLKETSGAGDNDKEFLFYENSVSNANTAILDLNLPLIAGNLIKVQSSVASKLAFNIFGIEVT